MIDIDHFKEVNDRYGHAAGDRVLAQFRGILDAAIRESDTPVRWGGEEFLVIARFANSDFAMVVAERIREMVEQHVFDLGDGQTIRRTCSIGFAIYPVFNWAPQRFNWEDAVCIADQCLYMAKRTGRNRWIGARCTEKVASSEADAILQVNLDVLVSDGYLHLMGTESASRESTKSVT
jgi:diguanylate cyclase (GGDEF)-like protein